MSVIFPKEASTFGEPNRPSTHGRRFDHDSKHKINGENNTVTKEVLFSKCPREECWPVVAYEKTHL